MALQNGREEDTIAATDIHHLARPRKVIGLHHRVGG
jgi:hypothetical protein